MDATDQHVDGNAAAGLLEEIFPFEMTAAWVLCAGCGSMDQAGTELVYADGPGMVMRCVHCESVLIRVAHGGGRYWLDLRGVVCLQIDDGG